MEEFLVYLLKVILLQSVLFGCYWFINRKSRGFQFNRYFLVATLILPFFIPLLKIPLSLFNANTASEGFFDPWYLIEQTLPIVTINSKNSGGSALSWWTFMLISLYFIIVFPSAIRLVVNYFRIQKLASISRRQEYTPKGFKLHYVPSKVLSFSFINRIFLSDLFPLKSGEKKTIVTHEEYHLTQLHSLDIILAELVRIICWFNPIVYLIQKNLKDTHEYLADRHTIRQLGGAEYASLLKSFKWQEINMMLGNGYSSSSIKNRLQMIEQPTKNSPAFKTLLLSFMALFIAFLFACEENLNSLDQEMPEVAYEFSAEDLQNEIDDRVARLENAPEDLIDKYVALQNQFPEYVYMPDIIYFTETEMTDQKKFPEVLKKGWKLGGDLEIEVEYFRQLKNEELSEYYTQDKLKNKNIASGYAVIRKAERLSYVQYFRKMNMEDYQIHDDFDQVASFKGGMPALISHLEENLKYPEIAKEKGIEDRLVMRFVVTKQGGLVYLNVDQPPATQDEEVSLEFQKAAFRALHSTEGMWQPAEKDGMYVMSKMTLPIEFKLDNKKSE